jgi:hypothetical protein
MTIRNISAAFDSRADAESAQRQVIGAGVAASDVHILEHGSESNRKNGGAAQHHGVWAHIKRAFLPDEDRNAHEESICRGGFLLTASVDDDLVDAAILALESSSAVDLDERQNEWRVKGWAGNSQSEIERRPVNRQDVDERAEQIDETIGHTAAQVDDTRDGSGVSRSARADAGKDSA